MSNNNSPNTVISSTSSQILRVSALSSFSWPTSQNVLFSHSFSSETSKFPSQNPQLAFPKSDRTALNNYTSKTPLLIHFLPLNHHSPYSSGKNLQLPIHSPPLPPKVPTTDLLSTPLPLPPNHQPHHDPPLP